MGVASSIIRACFVFTIVYFVSLGFAGIFVHNANSTIEIILVFVIPAIPSFWLARRHYFKKISEAPRWKAKNAPKLRQTTRNAVWHYLPEKPLTTSYKTITIQRIKSGEKCRNISWLKMDVPNLILSTFDNKIAEYIKESSIFSEVFVSSDEAIPELLPIQERKCLKCGFIGKAAHIKCPKCGKTKFFPSEASLVSGGDSLDFLYEIVNYHEPSALEKMSFGNRVIEIDFLIMDSSNNKVIAEGSVKKETTASFLSGVTAIAGQMPTLLNEAVIDIAELLINTAKSNWQGVVKGTKKWWQYESSGSLI